MRDLAGEAVNRCFRAAQDGLFRMDFEASADRTIGEFVAEGRKIFSGTTGLVRRLEDVFLWGLRDLFDPVREFTYDTLAAEEKAWRNRRYDA